MNEAAQDVFCQQFAEYDRFFACLFPAAFCRYRFEDALFDLGNPDYRRKPGTLSKTEILIAADWYEQHDEETAMLMRLAVEWNLTPPTERLRTLADGIKAGHLGMWSHTIRQLGEQISLEIEKVFAALYS